MFLFSRVASILQRASESRLDCRESIAHCCFFLILEYIQGGKSCTQVEKGYLLCTHNSLRIREKLKIQDRFCVINKMSLKGLHLETMEVEGLDQ